MASPLNFMAQFDFVVSCGPLKQSKGIVINIVGGAARSPSRDFMVGGSVNAALANFSKALAAQGLVDDVNVNWILLE